MTQTPRFREKQSHIIADLAKLLEHKLHRCTRVGNLDELKDYCRRCVNLAAELQKDLTCCLPFYYVDFPSMRKQTPDGVVKEWNLRHIDTWRAVTSSTNFKPVKALIPGLYRKSRAEGRPEIVEVVRPLIVVCGENDRCITRANQSASSSRTSKNAGRPKEVEMPGDDTKSRKPRMSSTLSGLFMAPRRTDAGRPSSNERGAKSQAGLDESDQRATKESFKEGRWMHDAVPDQESDESSMPYSDDDETQRSLFRQFPESSYDDNRSRTHRGEIRDGRGIKDRSTDRNVAGRGRGLPDISFTPHTEPVKSTVMREFGM